MKNITVSVPEDVHRAARVRAAEQGTSVSALVADYLRSLSETDRDEKLAHFAAEWDRLAAEITQFSASDRLSRDEVHDRDARRKEFLDSLR